MNHSDLTTFFGPPGTGKTRTLMRRVALHLNLGTAPSRIAYVGFTRASAREARARAEAELGLDPDELRYWSTLHSLAARELGVGRQDLLIGEHLEHLGEALDLELVDPDEEGRFGEATWARSRGRAIQYAHGLRRARGAELTLEALKHDMPVSEARLIDLFHRSLETFKSERSLLDYADLIEQAPGLIKTDVLIIDEAQDLTPAQWGYAMRLARNAKTVYIAGDDDQAIYAWAGADVRLFLEISRSGVQEVLDHSYRLPGPIHALAGRVTERIALRYPKIWSSSGKPGLVRVESDADQLNLVSGGSWMLLGRTRRHLDALEHAVRAKGMRYLRQGVDSVRADDVQAIRAWEALRKGRRLRGTVLRRMFKLAGLKGTPDPEAFYGREDLGISADRLWKHAFTGMSLGRRHYYEACLRRDPKALDQAAQVSIDTIHGCKGREADHVVIRPDITPAVRDGLKQDADAEHRVWYVAATRARRELVVLRPTSELFYDLGVYKRHRVRL